MLKEIDELTGAPVGHGSKSKTRDKLGAQYGLSKNTVARYLRVHKLVSVLKDKLDADGIGMRVAEALSYLTDKEQKIVDKLISGGTKISIRQADELKEKSSEGKITEAQIKEVLTSTAPARKFKSVKLTEEMFSAFFKEEQSEQEIEKILNEALEQYFAGRNK